MAMMGVRRCEARSAVRMSRVASRPSISGISTSMSRTSNTAALQGVDRFTPAGHRADLVASQFQQADRHLAVDEAVLGQQDPQRSDVLARHDSSECCGWWCAVPRVCRIAAHSSFSLTGVLMAQHLFQRPGGETSVWPASDSSNSENRRVSVRWLISSATTCAARSERAAAPTTTMWNVDSGAWTRRTSRLAAVEPPHRYARRR